MSEGFERSQLEDKLQLLVDASVQLLQLVRLDEIFQAVLELARRLNAADACAIWRLDESAGVWRIASSIGLSREYRAVAFSTVQAPSFGAAPFLFEDTHAAPVGEDRRELYREEGIRSLAALPMQIRGNVWGTLAFYYRRPHRFRETEMRVAGALASQAAAAIETAELYEEQQEQRMQVENARRRAAFLAEASRVLASSLDYTVTLATVARLAVPQMADWCVIEMVQPDGSLKRLALEHVDPDKVEAADRLTRKYPQDPNHGAPHVVRTGESEMLSEVPYESIEKTARDAEHLELLRTITSYMCVPLAARGRILGALSFVSAETGRHYGPEDLAFAEDLARRAAMAVDNAA